MRGSLNIVTKITRKREGWLGKCWWRGGGEVGEMLTLADKGWRGGWGNADNSRQRGEVGLDPPPHFLADIICEQPLTSAYSLEHHKTRQQNSFV